MTLYFSFLPICVSFHFSRHAGQRSRDPPTWSCIKEVVAASGIPVIGNGDVFTDKDAADMLQQTGCAGVMVARYVLCRSFEFWYIMSIYIYHS